MPAEAPAPASETAPRGIVVVGAPRSGTTLLRRLLDAHPQIAAPPETYLLSAAARFLHHDRFASGLEIGVLSGLAFAGFPEHEVLERLRGLVFAFLDDYAARAGKSTWAEKTAFDAFHLGPIRRLCQGHVRFVAMHRHGLDVALSLRDLVDKTGGYVSELRPYVQREPEPLMALADAWVDAAQAVADLVDDTPDAVGVSYEALVADPVPTMARVFASLGMPLAPEALEALIDGALGRTGDLGFGDWKTYARAGIDASSVARWEGLPPPVLDGLARRCNPTLARLGYPEVPRDAVPDDPTTARRRYELGLRVNAMGGARRDAPPGD